jgi:hypothetical protein
MKTLASILLLIVYGVVANYLAIFALNIAGLPGALLGGMPGKRSKGQFISGSIISAIGQSYVYLAYTAFVVNWTRLAADRDDVVGFFIWPFAFLAVFVPIWHCLMMARIESREIEHAQAQTEALHLTCLITLICFFIFAFVPNIMKIAWGWVPYMD